MIDHVEAPEIFVTTPDRRKCLGVLRSMTEYSEDVRFNTCSEVHLKVADKFCDPITGEWVKNPVYEHLEKNNLLYLCDDTEYFSFPNRTLRDDYAARTYGWLPINYGRRTDNGHVSMTYENSKDTGNDDGVLVGFALQPETKLHNISVVGGFQWTNLAEIQSNGSLMRYSDWYVNCNLVACSDYIPIEPYDVLSFRSQYYKGNTGNNIRYSSFCIYFYTSNDANTHIGCITLETASNAVSRINPVKRFSINSLLFDTDSLSPNEDITYNLQNSDVYPNYQNMSAQQKFNAFKNALSNGGYIRIDAVDNEKRTRDTLTSQSQVNDYKSYSSYYYTYDGWIHMGFSFPYDGWICLYSGQRFCKQIDNGITEGSYDLPLHWFVITDIDEDYDGNMSFKTVTAYSYEYTLNNRCISLSEDTLPFYIPDKILEAVNNPNWIIDKEYGNYNTTALKGAQCLKSGILNQILELLPEWKVGHISSELMTRYRTVGDVDNSNLYSFCMNDIETLYQCYFVFDCDNRTISAYTQEDIVENSNIILNWQNALKSLKIKDQDKNFITALRVHTADDTYGVGLVNPTGSSTIYNFNSILDKLDFVADTSNNDPLSRNKITENGVTRNRTLKEAVMELQNYIASPNITVSGVTVNSLNSFRDYAEKFVEANLNLIQAESALQMCISDYKSVVNQIAVSAEYAGMSSYYRYENVETEDELYNHKINHHFDVANGNAWQSGFINDSLFSSLQSASRKYYEAKDEYDTYVSNYNTYLNILKGVAKKTNLNYYNQKKLTTAYASDNTIVLSLLTPAEILALQPFIREGDWTNDNSVFSEDYDAKDIISTLISAFDQAKSDMDTFLSKPSYDFESSMFSWISVPEMAQNFKKLKVGKTLFINSIDDEYVVPMLLELHINYFDKDDFSMTFTTNYKRKVTELRFYDLYSEVNRISATDSTFTFNE